jgi:pimeloyl-ACP methyl ester carboxylesterase
VFVERTLDTTDPPLTVATGPAAGPPLLLLHGVVRRWQDFAPLLADLTTRWQVRALDFRGHGQSGRAAGRYFVADYVGDALACLRDGPPEPTVIYGHSLGALVAVAVAAEMPERVRALVLEDPPEAALVEGIRQTPFHALFAGMQPLAGSDRPTADVARDLAELHIPRPDWSIGRLGDVRDATSLRFTARCLRDLDPDVLTPLVAGRWLEGHDADATWRGVRCPVLLLRGEERFGGMLARAEAERLANLAADCAVINVPGVGHLLHWMATETTLRYVIGFLESL